MTIAIFGGTGGTGLELVKQALHKGYKVRVLARNPAKMTIKNALLTIIAGDATTQKDVLATLKGSDAVICVLGTPPNSKEKILGKATENILSAMQTVKVSRLIVQSSAPFMQEKDVDFFSRIAFAGIRKLASLQVQDKHEQETIVKKSSLDWTIVRPVRLNKNVDTQYKIGENLSVSLGDSVSRSAVAKSELAIIEDTKTFKKIVVVKS